MLHIFVIMPFGKRERIDFDKVYHDLILPASESANFEVIRADQELAAGNICTDMFQELLLADLVVADLTIDNPNVWYELGVRHALRSRGVVLLQAEGVRKNQPFDVYTDRKLRYHLKDGIPDPDYLEADKAALATMAKETLSSWRGRKISPVYHHLRYLKEPDWKSLRVEEAKEFWESHGEWERRMKVAQAKNRPGDVLVLADEAPIRILNLEAHRTAGKTLLSLGQYNYALEQYERALTIDPDDLESLRQKGILLGRLCKFAEAKHHLSDVIKKYWHDSESHALLGRVEKDAWTGKWREAGKSSQEKREVAIRNIGLLEEAIEQYKIGFRLDPGNYYPGINALTLVRLYEHLTGKASQEAIEALEGGVRWALHCALNKAPKDYWARVTLAEMELLSGDTVANEEAYKKAVAVSDDNWFYLDSSRQQLLLLNELGFRPSEVTIALGILTEALEGIALPVKSTQPRKVILFSGHMIDAPGRSTPRFPADQEDAAAKAIAGKLDEIGVGAEDLALCSGASGGDLLFAEACLYRGLRLEIRIPFGVPKFLQESVLFAGAKWRDRFYKVKENPKTTLFVMPDELGTLPKGGNDYERTNLWLLYTALSLGLDKVFFIALWNGKEGKGPGGTKHMHDSVKKHCGQVHIINTEEIFKL
jgi:tetratricopeptide (TPR) repeat protein